MPETSDLNKLTNVASPVVDFAKSLNLGSFFSKGSAGSEAINRGVNAAGNAALTYAVGTSSQSPTKYQKTLKNAGTAFDAATTAIGFIPGVGTAAAAILQGANWIGGKLAKKAQGIELSETLGSSSGYGGTSQDIGTQQSDVDAYNKAGGFAKLFGKRKKMDAETEKLKSFQASAANILKNMKKKQSTVGFGAQNIATQNELSLGGIRGNEIAIGEKGLKLVPKEQLKHIIMFKKGGKMNVIVDGKLHSENHDINIDIPITDKGVPVVEMKEGGELTEQSSEVERDELILHLDITKKLEELKNKGDQEAMIEAGKLLSIEIVKNTKDSKSKILKNA